MNSSGSDAPLFGATEEALRRAASQGLRSEAELRNGTSGVLPPEFSHDYLTLAFSQQHDGELLYVAALSKWFRWDGMRWAPDNTLAVFDLARIICRSAAALAERSGGKNAKAVAKELAGANTVSAIERLARSDRRHARAPGDFDTDQWALNTPAGMVDLRTGLTRPHRRTDLVTKVTGTSPGGDCPRWKAFLQEITQGNAAIIDFLQRYIGYSLCGSIREHAFTFLYGPGGNGKSVLINTVAAALGDYATTAMADVFVVTRSEQHSTNLAALRGARMVLVTEVEEGKPWAEARIKALVSGDAISARVMRGDPFEFRPTFKLWVSGNCRPALRNPDPAMRRRMNIVPLNFVPAVPDQRLADALLAELGGILAWGIEGCLKWQKTSLAPPADVTDATDDYFASEDAVSEWFAARCERKPGFDQSSRTLFADWKAWAIAGGLEPGSERRFSDGLERHAVKKKTKKANVFVGVKLLPSETGVW